MKLREGVLGVVVGVAMLAGGPTILLAQEPPPPGYQGGPGGEPWEAPPPEFQKFQQRGFHDGIEGARKDFGNHRPPNVNNREEYRHPDDVPGFARHDYRQAFRRGYQVGVQHIYGTGPRPY